MSLVQENPLWGLGEDIRIQSARAGDIKGRMAEEEAEARFTEEGFSSSSCPPTEMAPRAAQLQTWASLGKV